MNGSELIQFAINNLKADPNYADVDMSESSAFYNLVILPFSVLAKSVIDLNEKNLAGLKLDSMSSSQLDDYATLFFTKRRSETLITAEVLIYLSNIYSNSYVCYKKNRDRNRTNDQGVN